MSQPDAPDALSSVPPPEGARPDPVGISEVGSRVGVTDLPAEAMAPVLAEGPDPASEDEIPRVSAPPPRLEPWRVERMRREWALAANQERWLHAFVLLGEPATWDEYRRRDAACHAFLVQLTRGEGATGANEILRSPHYAAGHGLDEAGFAREKATSCWHRAAWYRLEDDLRRWAKRGEVTARELSHAFTEAADAGLTRNELMGRIQALQSDLLVLEDPSGAFSDAIAWVRLHAPRLPVRVASTAVAGPIIPGAFSVPIWSAAHLAEYVVGSAEQWEEALSQQPALLAGLPFLYGPEGARIRAAGEAAAVAVREFTEAFALKEDPRRDAGLWLHHFVWQASASRSVGGRPLLSLPSPWDEETVECLDGLVRLVDAHPERLEPALSSFVLPFWLTRPGRHTDARLARWIVDSGAADGTGQARRLLAWEVLWRAGDDRLRVGTEALRDTRDLVRLWGDPAFSVEQHLLDRYVLDGTLAAWARTTRQLDLTSALDRLPAQAATEERRRRFVRWCVGPSALRPGVEDVDGLLALVRNNPELFDHLLRDGDVEDWALARGLPDVTRASLRTRDTADPSLRRLRFTWILGGADLIPGVSSVDGVVDLACKDPERALRLIREGTLSTWLEDRGVPPPVLGLRGKPDPVVLHEWLWALGHPVLVADGRAFPDAAALLQALLPGDDSEARPSASRLFEALQALQRHGLVQRWLPPPTGEDGAGGPLLASLLDLESLLASIGFTAFYHRSCGWQESPAALARWADGDPERGRTLVKLLKGEARGWIQRRDPALAGQVDDALATDLPAEMALRALGLQPPRVDATEVPVLALGDVMEGEEIVRSLRVANRGPRGATVVRVVVPAPLRTVLLATQPPSDRPLQPGEGVEIRLVLRPRLGTCSETEPLRVLAVGQSEPLLSLPVSYVAHVSPARRRRKIALAVAVAVGLVVLAAFGLSRLLPGEGASPPAGGGANVDGATGPEVVPAPGPPPTPLPSGTTAPSPPPSGSAGLEPTAAPAGPPDEVAPTAPAPGAVDGEPLDAAATSDEGAPSAGGLSLAGRVWSGTWAGAPARIRIKSHNAGGFLSGSCTVEGLCEKCGLNGTLEGNRVRLVCGRNEAGVLEGTVSDDGSTLSAPGW